MIENHSRAQSTMPAAAPVRILIESSEYWLANHGDLAMLDVTLARLRQRWPHAQIGVLTDVPHLLRAYYPVAQGITGSDTDPWAEPSTVDDLVAGLGPQLVGPVALGWIRMRLCLPQKTRGARRRLTRLTRRHLSSDPITEPSASDSAAAAARAVRPAIAAAVDGASLVLTLGGGYLTDSDYTQAHRVLNLLEYACDRGIPVALVGQGLGPLDDPVLQRRAAEVLPRVGFLALRERLRGPAILQRAGVPHSRVMVTGDDAIELAYAECAGTLGSDIGVCLRAADYAPVSAAARETVRRVVRTVAAEHGSTLVPLIIAEYRSQDRRSTLPIVRGSTAWVAPLSRYTSRERIVEQVSRCRVVVTGAYHLAVFALARGIPVIALSSTRYYDDKFRGLEDMFGGGLRLLQLDDPALDGTLTAAMHQAWRQSDESREGLRKAARHQIQLGHEAFEHVYALVEPARVEHRRGR